MAGPCRSEESQGTRGLPFGRGADRDEGAGPQGPFSGGTGEPHPNPGGSAVSGEVKVWARREGLGSAPSARRAPKRSYEEPHHTNGPVLDSR